MNKTFVWAVFGFVFGAGLTAKFRPVFDRWRDDKVKRLMARQQGRPYPVIVSATDTELMDALTRRGVPFSTTSAEGGAGAACAGVGAAEGLSSDSLSSGGSDDKTSPSSQTYAVVRPSTLPAPTCAAYVALNQARYDTDMALSEVKWLLPVHTEHMRNTAPYFNTVALLQAPAAVRAIVAACVQEVRTKKATVIVAYESRALCWGAIVGFACGLPLVAARKQEDTRGIELTSGIVQEERSYRSQSTVCLDSFPLSKHSDVAIYLDDVANTCGTATTVETLLRAKCAQVHRVILIHCQSASQGILSWGLN